MKLSYYYNVYIAIAIILYISLMVIKEIFASTVHVTLINILLKKYDMKICYLYINNFLTFSISGWHTRINGDIGKANVSLQTCVRTTDSSGPTQQIQRPGRPFSRSVGQLRRRTDLSIPTTQRMWADLWSS